MNLKIKMMLSYHFGVLEYFDRVIRDGVNTTKSLDDSNGHHYYQWNHEYTVAQVLEKDTFVCTSLTIEFDKTATMFTFKLLRPRFLSEETQLWSSSISISTGYADPRSFSSDSRASFSRPFLTNHRGDSGKKRDRIRNRGAVMADVTIIVVRVPSIIN